MNHKFSSLTLACQERLFKLCDILLQSLHFFLQGLVVSEELRDAGHLWVAVDACVVLDPFRALSEAADRVLVFVPESVRDAAEALVRERVKPEQASLDRFM